MYCDIPDFGRCCFCLPLRRGVLIFGYLNLIFSGAMICVYSLFSHFDKSILLYKGVTSHSMTPALCIIIYCFDFVVNCLLLYGAHMKKILLLKIFYYYTLLSLFAALMLQVVDIVNYVHEIEMIILAIAGTFIQLYLLLLVRSLLRKLETGSEHSIENQLHAVVLGQPVIDNRIYNNTTAPTAPMQDDIYE